MSNDDCPCVGNTLDRFVRPSVMAVLARHPEGLHGYLVAQQLREIATFSDCPPDPTGLYRVLKLMESEGYLRSSWDVAGSGPARRIYTLTDAGHDCLRRWLETLVAYSHSLQQTIGYIEGSLGAAAPSTFLVSQRRDDADVDAVAVVSKASPCCSPGCCEQ